MSKPQPKKESALKRGINESRSKNNDEAALDYKVALRRKVLEFIGPDKAHIVDCFAGSGEMYKHVWSMGQSYVGCDLDFYRDDRLMYVCDNKRVLRAIDLLPYNIFDVDAYGLPWDQCLIVAARRPVKPGETIGMIVTDGGGMRAKLNQASNAFTQLTGYVMRAGMSRDYRRLHTIAIQKLAVQMRCDLVKHWMHEKKGGQVFYSSFILKGWDEPVIGGHNG